MTKWKGSGGDQRFLLFFFLLSLLDPSSFRLERQRCWGAKSRSKAFSSHRLLLLKSSAGRKREGRPIRLRQKRMGKYRPNEADFRILLLANFARNCSLKKMFLRVSNRFWVEWGNLLPNLPPTTPSKSWLSQKEAGKKREGIVPKEVKRDAAKARFRIPLS